MGGACGDGRSVWGWEELVGMGGACGDGRSMWGWEELVGMGGACGDGRNLVFTQFKLYAHIY